MSWKIDDRTIQEWSPVRENLIFPWSIECSDSFSFMSLGNRRGYRYEESLYKVKRDEHLHKGTLEVEMQEGRWKLDFSDLKGQENEIIREANILALEESSLADFALDFRFKKEFFPFAQIGSKDFEHQNKNICHQSQEQQVLLHGKGCRVLVQIEESHCPHGFAPWMYIKDAVDEWIVHARFLPIDPTAKGVIQFGCRNCRPISLPQFISAWLLRSSKLKKFLWYRSERSPHSPFWGKMFYVTAVGISPVKKGQKMYWKAKVKYQC